VNIPPAAIESIRIRGFRSLADVELAEIPQKVLLRWKAKGMDKTFGAHLTSDGSLRFFALVPLLNLPPEMLPCVILLDEPELGLHPFAVALIGGIIKSLAAERQVIVFAQLIDVSCDDVQKSRAIRSQFPTPEDINNNSATAPSKRVEQVIRRYKKTVDGPFPAREIGLKKIRRE